MKNLDFLWGGWFTMELKLDIKEKDGEFYYTYNSKVFKRNTKYGYWKEEYRMRKNESGKIIKEIFQDDYSKMKLLAETLKDIQKEANEKQQQEDRNALKKILQRLMKLSINKEKFNK